MNGKLKKKTWSEQDIAHLNLGHKLGASLKTMSIVLNRSEESLNKALGRLGIRQHGAHRRGQKTKAEKLFMITPQNFRDEIASYDSQTKPPLLSGNGAMASLETNENAKLNVFPNPFIIFPERKPQPLSLWSDLDCIITYLKKKGYKIQRCGEDFKMMGGVKIEFYLDGVPMSAAQLLVHANRLRLDQGLEPFYVESITEH